ncbi:MAG: dipeptide epimerase [Planctomycetota bacterium]
MIHAAPVLTFRPLELHLAHAWTIARGTALSKKNGLLTIECGGIVGMGEAAPNVRYGQDYHSAEAAFVKIKDACAGLDPMDTIQWIERAERVCGKDTEVVAALDMALLDWKGKKLRIPAWKLFDVSLDASRMQKTSYSIGMDSPEMLKIKIREADSFDIFKIKVGAGADEAAIAAIREITQKTLRADANEGWKSVGEAVDKIEWLQKQGVELIEQPLPAEDAPGAQAIWERVEMPIVADEASCNITDLANCIGGYHGVNIKLSKCGGITRALEMATAARAAGFKVMIGCMIESSLGIAAAVQIAALFDWVDLDGNLLIKNDPFVNLQMDAGRWRVPAEPGLGVALNSE